MDWDICRDALLSEMDDFEDAVLAMCAKNADADCVASRDKAFVQSRHSPIKVLMPNALLKKISQHK